MLDFPKNIQVRDRATLFNLAVGLDGYTISTGIISKELNGENIIARPLAIPELIRVGTVTRKNMTLSRLGTAYMEALVFYNGCFLVYNEKQSGHFTSMHLQPERILI